MAKKSSFWGKLWNDIKKGFSIGRSKTRNRKKTRTYSKPSKKVEQSRRTAARSVTNTVKNVTSSFSSYSTSPRNVRSAVNNTVEKSKPVSSFSTYIASSSDAAEKIKKVESDFYKNTFGVGIFSQGYNAVTPAMATRMQAAGVGNEWAIQQAKKGRPVTYISPDPSTNYEDAVRYEKMLLDMGLGNSDTYKELSNLFLGPVGLFNRDSDKPTDFEWPSLGSLDFKPTYKRVWKYKITDKEAYARWQKANTKVSGGKVEFAKSPSFPEGITIYYKNKEISKKEHARLKKGWDFIQDGAVQSSVDKYNKRLQQQAKTTANFSDKYSANSLPDVVWQAIGGEKNLFKGLYDYVSNYFFKPFSRGSYGTLMINSLVNLGETLDVVARPVRAFLSGPERMYTVKQEHPGMSQLMEYEIPKADPEVPQQGWVAEGLTRKEQSKLIKFLNSYSASYFGPSAHREKVLKARLKNAGLLDEYNTFMKGYTEWKTTGKGSVKARLKEAKKAFTTVEPYYADTGNVFSDLAVELITDPAVVFSVFSGTVRGGVKAITKRAVTDALVKTNIKNAGLIKQQDKVIQKMLIREIKILNDNVLRLDDKQLEAVTDSITNKMASRSFIEEADVDVFRKNLTKELQWTRFNKSKQVLNGVRGVDPKNTSEVKASVKSSTTGETADSLGIRGLRGVLLTDDFINKVDSFLLKGSVLVPYIGYKGVSGAYKKVVKGTRSEKVADNLISNTIERVNKNYSVLDYYDVMDAIKDLPTGDAPETVTKVTDTLVRRTNEHLESLTELLEESTNSVEAFNKFALNASRYLSKQLGHKTSVVDYLKDLQKFASSLDSESIKRFSSLTDKVSKLSKDVSQRYDIVKGVREQLKDVPDVNSETLKKATLYSIAENYKIYAHFDRINTYIDSIKNILRTASGFEYADIYFKILFDEINYTKKGKLRMKPVRLKTFPGYPGEIKPIYDYKTSKWKHYSEYTENFYKYYVDEVATFNAVFDKLIKGELDMSVIVNHPKFKSYLKKEHPNTRLNDRVNTIIGEKGVYTKDPNRFNSLPNCVVDIAPTRLFDTLFFNIAEVLKKYFELPNTVQGASYDSIITIFKDAGFDIDAESIKALANIDNATDLVSARKALKGSFFKSLNKLSITELEENMTELFDKITEHMQNVYLDSSYRVGAEKEIPDFINSLSVVSDKISAFNKAHRDFRKVLLKETQAKTYKDALKETSKKGQPEVKRSLSILSGYYISVLDSLLTTLTKVPSGSVDQNLLNSFQDILKSVFKGQSTAFKDFNFSAFRFKSNDEQLQFIKKLRDDLSRYSPADVAKSFNKLDKQLKDYKGRFIKYDTSNFVKDSAVYSFLNSLNTLKRELGESLGDFSKYSKDESKKLYISKEKRLYNTASALADFYYIYRRSFSRQEYRDIGEVGVANNNRLYSGPSEFTLDAFFKNIGIDVSKFPEDINELTAYIYKELRTKPWDDLYLKLSNAIDSLYNRHLELSQINYEESRVLNRQFVDDPDVIMNIFNDTKRVLNSFKDTIERESSIEVDADLDLIDLHADISKKLLNILSSSDFKFLFNTLMANNGAIGKYVNSIKHFMEALPVNPDTMETVTFRYIDQSDIDALGEIYTECVETNSLDEFYDSVRQYFSAKDSETFSEYLSFVNKLPMSALKDGDPNYFINFLQTVVSDTSGELKFLQALNKMYTEGRSGKLLVDLFNLLSDEEVGLTISKLEAVIASFGALTNANLAAFRDVTSPSMDSFMNRVQVYLMAAYGNQKVSLDAIRKKALYFDGSFYEKYADEIKDPVIQERITKLLSGGHLSPLQDVKVQMFAAIMENPECIARYNDSPSRVIFTDIETTSLNPYYDNILSIATKEWDKGKITEDSSLVEILDMIDGCPEREFHSYLDEADLDSLVNERTLESFYKDKHTFTTIEEMRDDFKKHYGAAAHGSVVTEKDIIREFITYIDTNIGSDKGIIPTLVFHNTNDFDSTFIKTRINQLHTANTEEGFFFKNIDNLDVLLDSSENTLKDLLGVQGDIVLSKAQMLKIREIISNFATELYREGQDFKLLNLKELKESCETVQEFLQTNQKVDPNDFNVTTQVKTDPLFKKSLDHLLGDGGLFETLDQQIFSNGYTNKCVMNNPFNGGVINRSEYLTRYLSSSDVETVNKLKASSENTYDYILEMYEYVILNQIFRTGDNTILRQVKEELNNLRATNDFSKVHPVDGLHQAYVNVLSLAEKNQLKQLGYSHYYNNNIVRHFFDVDAIGTTSYLNLNTYQKFVNDVAKARDALRSNTILRKYNQDFQNFIVFIRDNIDDILPPGHKYSIVKYLKVPGDPADAYLVAQKLFYIFLYNVGNVDIAKKFNISDDSGLLDSSEYFNNWLNTRVISNTYDDSIAFILEQSGMTNSAFKILTNENESYMKMIYKYYKPTNAGKYIPDDIKHLSSGRDYNLLVDQAKQNGETIGQIFEAIRGLTTSVRKARFRAVAALQGAEVKFLTWLNDLGATSEGSALRDQLVELTHIVQREMEAAKSEQILKSFIESEDNLLAYLCTLSPVVVIPLKGSRIHTELLSTFEQRLLNYNEIICSFKDNDMLYISLKAEAENQIDINPKIKEEPEAKVYFKPTDKFYSKPNLKAISNKLDDKRFLERAATDLSVFGTASAYETFKQAAQKLKEFLDTENNTIIDLTDGLNVGSTNTLLTKDYFKKLYENLPLPFRSLILDFDSLQKIQFSNGIAFDYSLLGEVGSKWYLDKTNDTDLILSSTVVNKAAIDNAKDEALVFHMLFTGTVNDVTRDLFKNTSNEEIIEYFKNHPEMVVVVAKEGRTSSGFMVELVTIRNETDLAYLADKSFFPTTYDDAKELQKIANDFTNSGAAYKWISKFIAFHKATQIGLNMNSTVVNVFDAILKGVLVIGSPNTLFKNIPTAASDIKQYYTIRKYTLREESLYKTDEDIYKKFHKVCDAVDGDITIDKDKYFLLKSWIEETTLSSANNRELTNIKKINANENYFEVNVLNKIDKGQINIKSLIDAEDRFYELDLEKAIKEYNKLPKNQRYLSREDFINIFSQYKAGNIDAINEKKVLKYRSTVTAIITRYNSQKIKRVSFTDGTINFLLKGMNMSEEVLRLAMLYSYLELGYPKGEAYRAIDFSQFDMGNKKYFDKIMELFIPFYSFEKFNCIFWASYLLDHPRVARIFEHVFSQMSWNFDEYDFQELITNYDLQTLLVSGAWNIGSVGEDRELFVKISPSFMSMVKWLYSPVTTGFYKLMTPYQYGLGLLSDGLGADLRFLFGDKFTREPNNIFDITKEIPIVGNILNVFKQAVTNYNMFFDSRYADTILKGFRTAPSLFEVYTNYSDLKRTDYDLYKEELKKDGLWLNENTKSTEEIWLADFEGLNSRGSTFSDLQLYNSLRGLYWDSNQGAFVPVDEFMPGGLNTNFDFNKAGEWERFIKLHEKYLGETWDYNLGTWVDIGEVSPGGLNSKNLTWEERKLYREVFFDELWDANQGKFVKREYYIRGGLNEENLSWDELSALNLAIHGTVWDNVKKKWVKVQKPTIKLHSRFNQEDKIDFSKTNNLRFKDFLVNRSMNDILSSYINGLNYKNTLTGNLQNDQKIFDQILSTAPTSGSRWNYYSGYAGLYRFSKQYPYPETSTNQYFRTPSIGDSLRSWVRSGYKRMNVYDKYYAFEYNALYTTLDQPRVRSYYPDHYFNKSDLSKELAVDRYAKGLYYSNRYPSLSSVTKRTMLENYKAMVWK